MKRLLGLTLVGAALGWAPAGAATEVLRWERLPLSVPLVVDQERVVFVDRNVRVGVPSSVSDRLRVQSAAGVVYLRASAPIEPTRLQLQDAESGELILLDIMAKATKDAQSLLEPIRIVTTAAPARDKSTSLDDASPRATPVPVVLTRYAAQHLYAPLRTVEALPGVRRVNLRRYLPLDTLLPSLPVHATALAAWRLDDHWVTAVRLRNTTSQWLDLDPRQLQGDIATATFQHTTLGPRGESSDTTVLYLVTRKHGLAESLLPTLSPIDTALNLPRPSLGEGDDDDE